MIDDYKKFCIKCGWNTEFGCIVPDNEEVYQCAMYMHYYPEEVKKFNEDMKKMEGVKL